MAAKNWSQTSMNRNGNTPLTGGIDELFFKNDTVSLCLMVNRRNRTLRVIDFRAGPTAAKRNFVIAAAQREGVEKVFTLVERDEVGTWTRLGFTREGSIPAFYKRSDAWILGAVVSQVAPLAEKNLTYEEEDPDDMPVYDDGSSSPAAGPAERTIQRAKRQLKDASDKAPPPVKVAPAREADMRKAILAAQRDGRALTGFEAFGRDSSRQNAVLTARGGFELYVSWEVQQCFGNSFLELLTGPRSEAERPVYAAAVRTLCDKLKGEGAVSTFTLAPADDVDLACVYLANGFRRSAVLARHIILGDDRKDAILWSKKLVVPES
jgi:hypothetical protein